MPLTSPKTDHEAILNRIAAIDVDLVAIQKTAAIRGTDMRGEWDKLFAERTALELRLRRPWPIAWQKFTAKITAHRVTVCSLFLRRQFVQFHQLALRNRPR